MTYEILIRLTVENEDDANEIINELNHHENTGLATDDAEIVSMNETAD